ncbi:WD40-repeat-containing domain protein [Cokeromyces recurvatus]|uniref:WD40-repeat-containing domain protein n=1 Tax=Cokeromyces recurvatus TaxID=90255 RepID=UPI00221F0E18|nr:WD40-repeat-containing domain protein [Cokeromyces recurvatus]KAI7906760.1 WD40-repeat-containing domain protein [Cokeromyces recurvatus]
MRFNSIGNSSSTSGSSSYTPQFTMRPSLKRSRSTASHLDTLNEEWLTAPIKCRQKTYDNTHFYDRFIPSVIDMPSAQARINNIHSFTIPDGSGQETFDEQIARAIGIDPSKRILSFDRRPPIQKVDVTKNSPLPTTLRPANSVKMKRRINMTPERILDAPYIVDDYYLNVLDWSKKNIVAIGMDKSVYLWNADTGAIRALKYNSNDQVCSLSWSSDGYYLAVGTESGDTQIWDVQSNTKLRSMKGGGQECRIGALAWDRYYCSSGAYNGSIFHHDVRIAKHVVRQMYGHDEEVCGLKWRWDGGALASGGNDNTVNIWDARVSQARHTKRSHTGAIKALAWCPWKHDLLATGGGRDDKKICFWDTTHGNRLKTIQTDSQVTSLNWSQHHREIVSTHGGSRNQINVWGYPSLEKIADIPAHSTRILHAALSPDGQTLATAAADENLKFWRIFDAEGLSRLTSGHQSRAEKRESLLRRQRSIR